MLAVPYTTVYDHTPLERFSKLDCSTTKKGVTTERHVFGKL